MAWFPDRIEPNAPVRTTNRQLAQQVDQVRRNAVVKAAKVDAIGFVASIGLHQIDGLTALEAQLIQHNPLGEPRFKEIGDTATVAIAREIAGMVWQ